MVCWQACSIVAFFRHCVTVLGMTPGLVAITGSAVVSKGYACAICTCL